MSEVIYNNTEEENGDSVEMMVDLYHCTDPVREHPDCRTNPHLQLYNNRSVCERRYRAATVCLVLLCFLLLTIIMFMCVRSKLSTEETSQLVTNITDQNNQFQTNIICSNGELNQENNNTCIILKELEGWIHYKSNFYFISTEKKSWTESRNYCQERQADLIIINNEKERKWVASIVGQYFWIGLNDSGEEGSWKWVDGTKLKSESGSWYSGEPNGRKYENCALLTFSQWSDYPCNYNYQWVCERTLKWLYIDK